METPTLLISENIAKIHGQVFSELPQDLFIPPDALQVFLETFEGPLDVLLYLIKKQNLDILDIPIIEITRQYIQYVELMQELRLELAAEYLVMAATLAEIKSRMLLPKPPAVADGDEADPRAELIRRLQEYEQFKKAAETLDLLPRVDRDYLLPVVESPAIPMSTVRAEIDLKDLFAALKEVMERAKLYAKHAIVQEPLSIRERMTRILEKIEAAQFSEFTQFFSAEEGRRGVVVTFIAILELLRTELIELVQSEPFARIYVKGRVSHHD